MPAPTQVKLLRVLQERAFERLGVVERRAGADLGDRLVERQREYDRIKLTIAQHADNDVSLRFGQLHAKAWKPSLHGPENPRQQIRCNCRDDAETKLASVRVFERLRDIDELMHFAQHALRLIHHALAHWGQHDLPAVAFDQDNAELVLEFAHLGRERWLADETRFRRTAEMPVLGHRNEIA